MVVLTAVAVVLGLAVSVNGVLPAIFLSLVWCVLPTPLLICALFGRGDIRAFAIGGLTPWILLVGNQFPVVLFFLPVWVLTMSAVCGAAAVATYRWLQRQA